MTNVICFLFFFNIEKAQPPPIISSVTHIELAVPEQKCCLTTLILA